MGLNALKSSFYGQYEQLSMMSMSLSNMSLSSMSIEYEQGNQVPGLGALDNIDIPARRNKTLPKALRTQALTTLTSNLGMVGLVW